MRPIRILSMALAVVLICPSSAIAGTVTAGTFTASPGEKNDVRYNGFGSPPISVVDLGAPTHRGRGLHGRSAGHVRLQD